MQKGYVQVYTGNGKGKTTAMLGLALRAQGAGLKVYIGQFLKNEECCEVRAINKYLPDITLEQYGTGFIIGREVNAEDICAAKTGLEKAVNALHSGRYDIVMLDEINVALHFGLLAAADVLSMIKQKPQGAELVLTGRYAAPEIIEAADLVSDVVEIKHYYEKSVPAREGVEK